MVECNPKNLSTHSYAINRVTFWSYRCLECRERHVLSRNWWQPVADMLRAGDLIFVSGHEWGCLLFVNTNTFDPTGENGPSVQLADAAVTVLPMGRTPL
jgi:hypothetical protein